MKQVPLKPTASMSKKDMLERLKFRCIHGHNGFSHNNCFLKARGIVERIGFLDIETSNLAANYGVILSWCMLPLDGDELWYDCVTKEDMRSEGMDKRIVETLWNCIMEEFDHIVGHYSGDGKFDVPYIRTRALHHNLDDLLPVYGEKTQGDTYPMAKNKLRLNSNRQGVIAEAITGVDIKTRITPRHWIKGLQGDKKALAYILHHNEMDVYQLEANWKKMSPFCRKVRGSI